MHKNSVNLVNLCVLCIFLAAILLQLCLVSYVCDMQTWLSLSYEPPCIHDKLSYVFCQAYLSFVSDMNCLINVWIVWYPGYHGYQFCGTLVVCQCGQCINCKYRECSCLHHSALFIKNHTWGKFLYVSLPYQILSELENYKEAEQAEPSYQAHDGQGPHICCVADGQVLSPQE